MACKAREKTLYGSVGKVWCICVKRDRGVEEREGEEEKEGEGERDRGVEGREREKGEHYYTHGE